MSSIRAYDLSAGDSFRLTGSDSEDRELSSETVYEVLAVEKSQVKVRDRSFHGHTRMIVQAKGAARCELVVAPWVSLTLIGTTSQSPPSDSA